MKVKFYKVTLMDGPLTTCVTLPAKNVKSAKLELQQGRTKVMAIAFLGWYLVDILMRPEGLSFCAYLKGDQLFITSKQGGYAYLYGRLGKVKQKVADGNLYP